MIHCLKYISTIATYADDTAVLASDTRPQQTSMALQTHFNLISTWATQRRI